MKLAKIFLIKEGETPSGNGHWLALAPFILGTIGLSPLQLPEEPAERNPVGVNKDSGKTSISK